MSEYGNGQEPGVVDMAADFLGDTFDAGVDWIFGEEEGAAVDPGYGDVAGDDFLAGLGLGNTGDIIDLAPVGPDQAQLTQIEAMGGDVLQYLPPGTLQAAQQVASTVLANNATGIAIRALLKRSLGWVFDSGPNLGGRVMSVPMVELLMEKMKADELRAMLWRASGGESPIPDASKIERETFAILFAYDAMRAMNAQELAKVIADSQPKRTRR